MVPIEDGHAVHYNAVQRGIPVYGSDEQVVGKVVEVLDNHREHIMDGVVFETPTACAASWTRRRWRARPSSA